MKISLTDAGKRFNRDWIFRHFNYQFTAGHSYAITGPNGSGKSTLLQVLGGSMMLSEGSGQWDLSTTKIDADNIYRYVSICAPYLELVEEMTLREFLDFHSGFKPFLSGINRDHIIKAVNLEKDQHKQIRYFSSGMKQRVKLAQAFFSDTPVLLLDEPCTNLDAEGIELYHSLVSEQGRDRLVIVSSNDEVEYRFCSERIPIMEYKTIRIQ